MDRLRSEGGPPSEIRRGTIPALPPPTPLVFDAEVPRHRGPGCHHRGEPPDPFPPHDRYGFVLLSLAIHLRMLGLSVAKVVDRVDAAHGIRLGSAAVLRIEHWAAEALGAVYESPEAQLRHVPGVHGDVTSFRLNGDDGWAWVFVTVTAFVFRINPSRG